MTLNRNSKFNFFKMEIAGDTLLAAARALMISDEISREEFKERFWAEIGYKPNQDNYAITSLNFLNYYGLITESGKKIYIRDHNRISYMAKSFENSSAMEISLLNFEFDNQDDKVKNEIDKLISKFKMNEPVYSSEIQTAYEQWFTYCDNTRLKKGNTKDTSQMFVALLISRAIQNGVVATIPLTKPYSSYNKKNIKVDIDYSVESLKNFLVKTKKANAKKKIEFTEIDIDFNLIIDNVMMLSDIEYELEEIEQETDKYKRNMKEKEKAIAQNGRICIINPEHKTFELSSGEEYVEMHHIVMLQSSVDLDLEKSDVDISENIIPLCPLCHRAVHFGSSNVRRVIVKELFSFLEQNGVANKFNLDEETLLAQYKVVKLK